ncbi:MAG: hypothetical protein M1820_005679 [Bogoriella megaspora]|nr:MAG: hypothetical protein M1820_005679 [Bogoriella megaspora]
MSSFTVGASSYALGAGSNLQHSNIPVSPPPAFTRSATSTPDTWGAGRQKSSQSLRGAKANLHKMPSLSQANQTTAAPLKIIPSHGKLHKRGNSASSISSPSSPAYDNHNLKRSETQALTYEYPPDPLRAPPAQGQPSKIKPYLRKLSTKDSAPTLDLSRPAAENEGLAGLGIHDFGSPPASAGDVSFNHTSRRAGHGRSQSVNSTYSTGSGAFKPTQPFVHPMHKTRPYTPPSGNSYVTAPSSSEEVPRTSASTNIMTEEEYRHRQEAFEPYRARRSTSTSATPNVASPLNVQATGSSTNLPSSASQTNLSIRSSSANGNPNNRPRGQTMNSFDTYSASPSSRPSLDKTFTFMRGSKDQDVGHDSAASRAASINAARIKFNEKEEAKERKLVSKTQREEQRQREQILQKKLKEEKRRQMAEMEERSRFERVNTAPEVRASSRPRRRESETALGAQQSKLEGKEYAELVPSHSLSLPMTGTTASAACPIPAEREKYPPATDGRRSARGGWWRFLTWLRTRLLRLGRKC